jgi:hypothetical protein
MSKKLSATAVGLIVMVFCLPAVAQEAGERGKADSVQQVSPEKRALILEMLEVMKAKQGAEQVFNVMSEQMEKTQVEVIWKSLKDTAGLTPEEKETLHNEIAQSTARAGKTFRERLYQRINYGEVVQDISLELYAKYFTESELQDLVNFYKSPTGQKSLDLLPTLLAESMTKAGERLTPVIMELTKEIAKDQAPPFQKKVNDLIKSHHRISPKGTRRTRG